MVGILPLDQRGVKHAPSSFPLLLWMPKIHRHKKGGLMQGHSFENAASRREFLKVLAAAGVDDGTCDPILDSFLAGDVELG